MFDISTKECKPDHVKHMLHVIKDKLHIPVGSNHEVVRDSAFLKREVQLFTVTP